MPHDKSTHLLNDSSRPHVDKRAFQGGFLAGLVFTTPAFFICVKRLVEMSEPAHVTTKKLVIDALADVYPFGFSWEMLKRRVGHGGSNEAFDCLLHGLSQSGLITKRLNKWYSVIPINAPKPKPKKKKQLNTHFELARLVGVIEQLANDANKTRGGVLIKSMESWGAVENALAYYRHNGIV